MSKAYAKTWLDVGRLPLRRRDRAAMVLALECLRASDEPPHVALQRAETILDAPGYDGRARSQVWNALCAAQRGGLVGEWLPVQRLLRARLALLLRVLLRVDAGDYGRNRCHCGAHVVMDVGDRPDGTVYECWWCTKCRAWAPVGEWPRRTCRPLWEAAR